MKKRWLVNLLLLVVLASLVAFLYLKPKNTASSNTQYEVSTFKLAEFDTVNVEFPAKAGVSFKKVNNFWMMTAPNAARADQVAVQRILSIIAAKSENKIEATDSATLDKFGLNNPAIKLSLVRPDSSKETFLFGTHNPVNDEQYVLHNNAVYLLENIYAEAAETQLIEMFDKTPFKPTEKIRGFDFTHLEQWESTRLNLDLVDGKWVASIKEAKPNQNELNEWLDFSWLNNPAKSLELYTPDQKVKVPSFIIKMQDGSKVKFDKVQESPELLLGRPDEGILYHYPSDAGFSMLNPPLNLPTSPAK